MGIRYIFLIFVALILVLNNVSSDISTEEGFDPSSQKFFQSPTNIPQASSSEVSNALQQGWISDDNLKYLDVEQLKGNLKYVSDWGKLDQKELSKVISEESNVGVSVDVPENTVGAVSENSFSFPAVNYLDVDNTQVLNGKDVSYSKNSLNVGYADTIKNEESVFSKIKEFKENSEKITIDSASLLISDNIQINNPKDAEYIIDDKQLFTKSQNVDLIDPLGNNAVFDGDDKSSAIIISKKEPFSYSIAKGTLTISHDGYDEVLSTFSTAAATLSTLGLTMIEMNPTTSYTQNR